MPTLAAEPDVLDKHQLLTVLIAGILLCAGAGTFIARRDLQPLREITETARRITVSNLDERICDGPLPEELQPLSHLYAADAVALTSAQAQRKRPKPQPAHVLS